MLTTPAANVVKPAPLSHPPRSTLSTMLLLMVRQVNLNLGGAINGSLMANAQRHRNTCFSQRVNTRVRW